MLAKTSRTTRTRHPLRWSLAVVAAAAALLASACGAGSAAGGGDSASPTVRVTYLPILSGAALFVAQDKGYFGQYGIKNVYSKTANPYNQIAGLSQGGMDVLLKGSAVAWFNAINSGLKVRDVVDRLSYDCSSDEPFLVSEKAWNSGVRTLADLKGKVVSNFAKGSAADFFLDQALSAHGLSPSMFKQEVGLSYPNAETALQTGAITAGFVANPQGAEMVKDGKAHVLMDPYSVVPSSGYSAGQFAMSQSFLGAAGGRTAVDWVAAYLKGVRYLEDPKNKADVISILAKWTGVSKAVLTAEYGTDQWIWINPNGQVDERTVLDTYGKYATATHQLNKLPAPNAMYDGSVVRQALKMVGTVPATRSCANVPKLK